MAARSVFSSVRKHPQILCTRLATAQLSISSARVHSLAWLVRKHVVKIALGAGLGISGIVANSQLGNLGFSELEKEAVVVGNDLSEAFAEDVEREIKKELMKLGKLIMHDDLATNKNTEEGSSTKIIGIEEGCAGSTKDTVIEGACVSSTRNYISIGDKANNVVKEIEEHLDITKKGLEEAIAVVEKIKDIEESTDKLIMETSDLLDDTENLVDGVKDVIKEGFVVFDHLQIFSWKIVKLTHAIVNLLLPLIIVLYFIE
eukprot:GFUD01036674.1.p1 GENE.GFUD01036674.1~~GFUD01036674.1.p1  ORF type:complete len:269 (+),score=68.99 GFUD01036674.1:31-807(+)